MCGIAGFTRFDSMCMDAEALLSRMNQSLVHRGPDAGAIYADAGVGLCHRRLSILDLSDSGAQPMTSHSGRYVMVYNGEIYNFPDIRADLEKQGVTFRGRSDSEVLLALYERDGPACLSQLNGMFALAIWDTQQQRLFLARDRLGKKPLYFYRKNDTFIFASEIKAILCVEGVDKSLRMDAIADYFYYQYIPDPKSVYKHIHKLNPGCWLTVDANDQHQHQYWNVSFSEIDHRSESDLQEELLYLLDDAVRIRMLSDVPLGAFLSGGVDSSAIVGLMAKNSDSKVNTCSIGFASKEFDEVDQARRLAQHFDTRHEEYTVNQNIALDLLDIASWFDEPFADPSFVPTYFVSKLARQNVTVALSGDGGDENFAGYSKYLVDQSEHKLRAFVPSLIGNKLFPALCSALDSTGNPLLRRGASRFHSLSLDAGTGFAVTNSFFRHSTWNALIANELKQESANYSSAEYTRQLYLQADTDDHLSRVLYTDLKSYLPGDILVKVDRMSMANSLETRAPLLDYRLVEFAASVPSHLKLANGHTKYLLKQCAASFLPAEVLTRRKRGFSVPLAQWLRADIKDIASEHLFSTNSGLSRFFDISMLKRIWQQHQSGRIDHSSELWSLLIFELWWQRTQVPDGSGT